MPRAPQVTAVTWQAVMRGMAGSGVVGRTRRHCSTGPEGAPAPSGSLVPAEEFRSRVAHHGDDGRSRAPGDRPGAGSDHVAAGGVPARRPSSRASRRAGAVASSVETRSISPAIASVPQRDHEARPDSVDAVRPGGPAREHGGFRGLTATMRCPREWSRSRSPVPRSEAAVPTLCTKPVEAPGGPGPDLVGQRVISGELVGVLQLVGPETAGLLRR